MECFRNNAADMDSSENIYNEAVLFICWMKSGEIKRFIILIFTSVAVS